MTTRVPDLPFIEDVEDEPTDAEGGPRFREARLVDARYRIHREIGRGGMSVVYLAEHIDLRRLVALKILAPAKVEGDRVDFAAWFRREARTLAGLQHPNVVLLHDFGEMRSGSAYLVMEYVDGPSLATVVKPGPLPVARVLHIATQVADALRYLHSRSLVHRDVKPSNILLQAEGTVDEQAKLIDFGIALALEGRVDERPVAGSAHCIAPEQIAGELVGPAADVYALGAVMYRALAGHWPNRGKTGAEALLAQLTEPVVSLRLVAPQVPGPLADMVSRCLSLRPEDRPKDGEAVYRELRALARPAAAEPAVATSATQLRAARVAAPAEPEPVTSGGSGMMWVGAGLLVACVGAVAYLWLQGAPVTETAAVDAPSAPAAPSADPSAVPPAPGDAAAASSEPGVAPAPQPSAAPRASEDAHASSEPRAGSSRGSSGSRRASQSGSEGSASPSPSAAPAAAPSAPPPAAEPEVPKGYKAVPEF